ncbi:MAG: hypothetical protein GY937_04335 [bacterium]|nr:hypothetical protein [bacterium]
MLLLIGILAWQFRTSETLQSNPVGVWLAILLLLAAFGVIAGHGVSKNWRGLLIDQRNRMSLSRLQFAGWTLLVLSGILTAALMNLAVGWDPLEFTIPQQLFVLMGISTASLVASPAILTTKGKATSEAKNLGMQALKDEGYDEVWDSDNIVVANTSPLQARWADMLKGEELGNAAVLDLGKVQMFFFTFVLFLAYASALAGMFREAQDAITQLPPIQDGMNVLLGISHTGYLSNKTVSHTPAAPATGTP